MHKQTVARRGWSTIALSLRAIVSGLLMALVPTNVWPLLLTLFDIRLAALFEATFLGVYVWWAGGAGPPRGWQVAREQAFRRASPSRRRWFLTLTTAVFFAVAVHASIVLLFRLVTFPMAEFRQGYDLSFIPSASLKWLAVVISATSAAICEEVGFRGYMHRPLEIRFGPITAILISSLRSCTSPRAGRLQGSSLSCLERAYCSGLSLGIHNRFFPA
jgi:membrane protease YdiL (CAAX protease family)